MFDFGVDDVEEEPKDPMTEIWTLRDNTMEELARQEVAEEELLR